MAFRDDFQDDEPQGFLQRHRGAAILLGLVIFGGGCFVVYKQFLAGQSHSSQTPAPNIVMLHLQPPPPPPPPPPPKLPPPPPQQDKMVVQEHVDKVDKPPDKPPEPAANVTTGIKGAGPSSMALGPGDGNGSGNLGNYGGGQWGWYASEVQARITSALQQNARTRTASMRIEVRIWPDSTGRVTRAQLVDSTGDQAVDNAIKNDVLTGLQLQEPPPAGMPTPIVLRLTAQRPAGTH